MATRRSNKRRRRNRGRFGLLYKLFSLLIILVVTAAGCAVFFRVETVTVAGEQRYTSEDVIKASGIEQGDNLFLLNRPGIARRIQVSLPYVEQVSIQRVLPDGVLISVTECLPAAVVQGEDRQSWWIINTGGKILEQTASGDVQGAARISGITAFAPAAGTRLAAGDENAGRLERLLELMGALERQEMMDKVRSISLEDDSEILVNYDNWIVLEIDTSSDFQEEAAMLKIIIDSGDIQTNERGTLVKTQSGWYSFIPSDN